jgi:predicted dehydrogenase
MNRRAFSKHSILALASTTLPAFAQPDAAKPVGYAVIGLGTICDLFSRGCANSSTAKITALVTGHPDTKGKEWADRLGIPATSIYTYETFDTIKDNKNVDAVYVGLPNSMHREYTLRAAQAGKHVLCEKPMAISAAECREMIDGCKKANVKLMIGYRCHLDPTHLKAEEIIQSGQLGKLQAFEGAFGFNARPVQWRLTKKYAGGGSLFDVGIYPLNAMRYFAREEPVSFTATTSTIDHTSGRFAEMEQTVNWTMTFPSGISASLASTYGASMPGFVRIHGDKGSIEIAPAFDYKGVRLHGLQALASLQAASPDVETFHFQREAEHFASCIRTNTEPRMPGEEGLKDLLAIEAIYKAAGKPIA